MIIHLSFSVYSIMQANYTQLSLLKIFDEFSTLFEVEFTICEVCV